MNLIHIIEICISLILFVIIIKMLVSKKKNYKFLPLIVVINIILITHLGIDNIIIQKKENELIDKQVSAKQVQLEEKTIQDITPPVITLQGEKEINLKNGEIYQEIGYSAIDNLDGSIVGNVVVIKKKISDTQYKMIYTVKDSAGNNATAERIINLEEKQIENKTENKNENIANQNTNTKNEENKTTQKKNTTGVIYLTFDDGPTNSSTTKILDILKEENVKATFFILNYNSSTEALVKREVEEGHSIGIHGYSHDYEKIYQSVDSYMENLNKLQNKIYQSTRIKTTLTRFPGGSSNTISKFNPGIMTKLTKEIQRYGYQYCDWNVNGGDAENPKDSQEIYENVINGLYPNKNNIVLLHDFSSNQKTIDALKKIIQYGKENNYVFKAITSDTPMIHHKVAN